MMKEMMKNCSIIRFVDCSIVRRVVMALALTFGFAGAAQAAAKAEIVKE